MIGRERELYAVALATVAQEHVLLLGPPGVAKSLLVDKFATDAGLTWWRYLLMKFSSPDEVFGPFSLDSLKKGSWERALGGRMCEAQVVFLDEIFKANSAILNSLLTALNERVFFNPHPVKIPLVSCIGASNEVPNGDQKGALAALWDRFLVRLYVEPVGDDRWADLLTYDASNDKVVDAPTLIAARDLFSKVKVEHDVVSCLVGLRAGLRDEHGIEISDRRFCSSTKVVRASAALAGRVVCSESDVQSVQDVWWEELDQRDTVKDYVLTQLNPNLAEITKLQDSATSAVADLKATDFHGDDKAQINAFTATNRQLKDIVTRLSQLGGDAADEAAAVVARHQNQVRRFIMSQLDVD